MRGSNALAAIVHFHLELGSPRQQLLLTASTRL